MSRSAAIALIALFTLVACSGSGSTPGVTDPSRAPSSEQSTPYQISVVSDPTLPAATSSSSGERNVQESFGGIPSKALIIDAANFPPGSQANFAIVSVSAIENDVAYPIVQFPIPAVINVLNYQENALLLGAGIIPSMQYQGVQYVIDPAKSSVVIGGKTYPMSFGTMASSTFTPFPNGLAALYFPDPVNASKTPPNFLVDFNAATWITIKNNVAQVVPQGDGTILSQSAEIQGTILNKAGGPVVNAVVSAYGPDGVIVNSAPSAADGTFDIHAISGDGYSLVVWNTYAPVSSIIVDQASGNDPLGWNINGPFVNVPAGYSVNVGVIRD